MDAAAARRCARAPAGRCVHRPSEPNVRTGVPAVRALEVQLAAPPEVLDRELREPTHAGLRVRPEVKASAIPDVLEEDNKPTAREPIAHEWCRQVTGGRCVFRPTIVRFVLPTVTRSRAPRRQVDGLDAQIGSSNQPLRVLRAVTIGEAHVTMRCVPAAGKPCKGSGTSKAPGAQEILGFSEDQAVGKTSRVSQAVRLTIHHTSVAFFRGM